MWEYLLANATWSVGGLLVGYSLGHTERTVERIAKQLDNGQEQDRAE